MIEHADQNIHISRFWKKTVHLFSIQTPSPFSVDLLGSQSVVCLGAKRRTNLTRSGPRIFNHYSLISLYRLKGRLDFTEVGYFSLRDTYTTYHIYLAWEALAVVPVRGNSTLGN